MKLYRVLEIRIIKKQNTFDLSIAVKFTIILFLCGSLNCIRADLFMNNALYKCCIMTHHSLRCVAQRSDKQDAREAMGVVFSVLTKRICMHKTKFLMNIFKYCFKNYIK